MTPEPSPAPEPAQVIRDTVAANPAPTRREGGIFDAGRLRHWYDALRQRLQEAIQQAREIFRRETTSSAESAGWTDWERRQAGVERPQETQEVAPIRNREVMSVSGLDAATVAHRLRQWQRDQEPDDDPDDDPSPSGPGMG